MTASPAKITPPRLSGVYPRHRLFKQLDQSRRRPIVWLTGPPGSGKTTLIGSYLAGRKLSHLWYQVDVGDSDPATFFYYLGLAAAKASPKRRTPLPLLAPEYQHGLSTFTLRFFERLFERLRRPFVMVFDNYHEVPAESRLHEVICGGLSGLPEGVRAIVISRAAPPACMARLRANQAMEMVEWEDLRLTKEDLKGFVTVLSRERLPEPAIRALHAETEGWAAGVVLMLERSKSERLGSLSIGQPVHEAIFDYFAGEILGKTDARTQDFLLQTSFLPRLTARMAERLTGLSDAGAILSDMNRRNYFTTRHADAEPMYQYHDLFRDFLQTRARESFGHARLAQVRHRAATVLEASGQIERAVELYCNAEDWAEAARLILTQAPSLAAKGRSQTLEKWIRLMPTTLAEETPWLLYWLSVSRMPFDLTQSRGYFEKAFERFHAKRNDPVGTFLSWCGVVDTFVYEWGDFSPLDRWIAALENLLGRYPEFPSPEVEARVTAAMFCALMYRQPHHPKIGEWEERVKAIILGSADERFRLIIGHHLLLYYSWWQADLGKATVLFNALCPAKPSTELPPLMVIAWYAIEAAYRWMTASHEACLQAVSNGLEIARKSGVHVWDFMLLGQSVHSLLSTDQFAAARDRLAAMRTILTATSMRRLDWAHYHYLMIWEALGRNDPAQALEEAEEGLARVREAGVPFVEGALHTAAGHVMLRLNRLDRAADHLNRAREIAHKIGSKAVEYLYLLLEAEMGLFYGDEAAGLEALRKLMALARRQAVFNHGGWQNPMMARICVKALGAGIETDFVRELARRRNLIPEPPPVDCEDWPWDVRVMTLGEFSLLKEDKTVRFSERARQKPLELLKALIAFGGREVGQERLSEALWPDAEGDAARRAFDTTLHRLRKILGHDEALVLEAGRLTLDPRRCCVDVWTFERLLERMEAKIQEKPTRACKAEAARLTEKALALYRGPFLGEQPHPWALTEQERLRSRFLRHLDQLGRYWERAEEWGRAVECYCKGLEVDPLAEELYQRLMTVYHRLGRRAEALAAYQRCRKALQFTFGMEPSSETEAVLHRINQRDA